MTLHGKGGDADIMLRKFGWNTWADAHGVMIVSPNGTIDPATNQRAWNAGIRCISGVDDVGFLGTVVHYIQSHYKINPDRFFVWGYSNGGMMSLRMGYQSVWFKGIGDGEGSLGITFDQCAPSTPWFHSHALGDTTVPFNGGHDIEGIVFPYSIPDIMTFWDGFYPVQLITINDCSHNWSCWSGITPPLFDQVWAFWQSHL
jgi:poly(3-hydroxybutyrate) depolymerase